MGGLQATNCETHYDLGASRGQLQRKFVQDALLFGVKMPCQQVVPQKLFCDHQH